MRSFLLLLSLTMSVLVSANTYFVAPNGRDSYQGTMEQPWGTWGKAFASVNAGDSVYFRGGVYYSTAGKNGYSITKSGTVTDTIFFLNYPGEVPILDCDDRPIIASDYSQGVTIKNNSYVKFKGLTIRNVWQYDGDDEACGISLENANNIVIENCTVYNTHGAGFRCYVMDETYFINCDSYNNCDSLTTVPEANPLPGNDGYGFAILNWVDNTDSVYFRNCRAWKNGDDGFAISQDGYTEFDGCWSFRNGILQGGGQGFKMGWIHNTSSVTNALYKNCVAAFNRVHGWTTNDQEYSVGILNVYNCTSYHNGYQGWHNPEYGFYIENTAGSDQATEAARRIFKNNLAYDNDGTEAYAMIGAGWTNTYNSWNTPPGATLSDADFISVDSTGLTAARQADGSLPNNNCYNNFLKLAATSDLINTGTDVGLAYEGSAPDLGAFESSTNTSNLKLVNNIEITAAGGTAAITTNKGTLQLSAAIAPTNATNQTVTWSIANGTGQATISPAGLVTAVSNGTVTARATANDGSGIYGTLVITISGQVIPVTGITVTGAGGSSVITTDNGTLQLAATIAPTNATNQTVTWTIANGTGQATISTTGLVMAISNGTVTARATANDGSGVYGQLVITISSQVILVTGITVTGAGGSSVITTDNGTLQLSAVIAPANATNQTVTWTIANSTGQATISTTGLVTAVSNGTVTARATANDGSGIYGTLVITISNQEAAANQSPIVALSSPTKNTSYISPATITIDAVASDPDGIITKVEFYQGTIKLGERTVAPYSYTWKEVTVGTYAISAVATDNKNTKATSATVTVVVEKAALSINQIPLVSIISPLNNKKYKKNEKIVIEAVASDPDGTVSKVEFKSGNITIAELTSAPYLFAWEDADTGMFILTAIATDNLGATSTSANIELIVESFYDTNSEIINLYPNPNSGHFTIDLRSALPQQDCRVSIVNLTGKLVYKGVLTQEEYIKEIDISNSASGTYILMVSTIDNVITAKKFIKN